MSRGKSGRYGKYGEHKRMERLRQKRRSQGGLRSGGKGQAAVRPKGPRSGRKR